MRGIGQTARAALWAAALSGLMMATIVAPASASQGLQYSMGACSASPYQANYSVTYEDYEDTDDGYHYIYTIQWDIAGPLGSRSNVEARVKEDNNLGHDKMYHVYISNDDISPGKGQIDLRSEKIKVPRDYKMYVEFKFVFDIPNEEDKSCSGHTRNV